MSELESGPASISFDFWIVGCQHREINSANFLRACEELKNEKGFIWTIDYVPEPDNQYDENAVRAEWHFTHNFHIGYISKASQANFWKFIQYMIDNPDVTFTSDFVQIEMTSGIVTSDFLTGTHEKLPVPLSFHIRYTQDA